MLAVRGQEIALRYQVEGPFVVRGAAGRLFFLLVVPGIVPWGRRRDPAFRLISML